jgi:hypothetical protein
MSLPVLLAFAGVLVAAVATGMIVGRCVRRPRVCFVAWAAGTLGLTVALGAAAMGLASGFGPSTFRAVQLGVQLLGPLWLAWGLVEVVARGEAVRFGARLICIVAGLILATDTLTTQPFSRAWPAASQHYQSVSHYALLPVQLVAVITVLVAVSAAAARTRNEPELLPGVVAIGLAILATVALRFSLPARSAYPLLADAGAGLVRRDKGSECCE